MTFFATSIVPAPARIRIISIDGGGIYGLATAVWLRRLCEKNRDFLNGDDVRLFAGTSAGALNCLLLAQHDRPREVVLSGALERFWDHPGTFANTNPMSSLLSFTGMTGWFSDADFRNLLQRTFGKMTLGDLPQQVLISTYNWTGGKPQRNRTGQEGPYWKPKFFNNACVDDDDHLRGVVEVAYAAAAPPTLRPIVGGYGDGGTFSGNPAVAAVAHIKRHYRLLREGQGAMRLEIIRNEEDSEKHGDDWSPQNVLERIAVLSIGSGQKMPHLAQGNVNKGLLFTFMPTNPAKGDFWPTSAYCVDASNEEAQYIVEQLIGSERALRLNPAVLAVPAVPAAMLARFSQIRDVLLAQIRANAQGQASTPAIEATLEFLSATHGWDGTRVTDYCNWTPPRELADRTTPERPALGVTAHGRLAMAWAPVKRREKTPDIDIWVSILDDVDARWSPPRPAAITLTATNAPPLTGEQQADGVPALAGLGADGDLIMVFRGRGHEGQPAPLQVTTSRFVPAPEPGRPENQALVWRTPKPARSPSGTAFVAVGTPALATNRPSELFLAWCSSSTTLCVARGEPSGDDVLWSEPVTVKLEAPIDGTPGLAASPDRVALAWNDENRRRVWMATSRGGAQWSEPFPLALDAQPPAAEDGDPIPDIDGGPALSYFCGRWHMAWKGEDDENVWVAVSRSRDPLDWYPPVQLRDRTTSLPPALGCVQGTEGGRRLVMACCDVMELRYTPQNTLWVASLQTPPIVTVDRAVDIARHMLRGFSEGDYELLTASWSKDMRDELGRAQFLAMRKEILDEWGPFKQIKDVKQRIISEAVPAGSYADRADIADVAYLFSLAFERGTLMFHLVFRDSDEVVSTWLPYVDVSVPAG